MDKAKSPEQVVKAMTADWLQEGLKYKDIARITGYKYQTIANIIGKKTYFKALQAKRFISLGYCPEFLMFGIGCLKKEDNTDVVFGKDKNSLPDDFKLAFLMNYFKKIADICDMPLMQEVYEEFHKAITTEDMQTSVKCFMEIQQHIILATKAK